MINGYLCQFSVETLITLNYITSLLSEKGRLTKVDFEVYLNKKFGHSKDLPFITKSKARNAFTNAWKSTNSRSIKIENKTYNLIVKEHIGQKHFYSLAFNQLLKALKPNASRENLQKLSSTLLSEVISHKTRRTFDNIN